MWRLLLGVGVVLLSAANSLAADEDQHIKVEIRGVLKSGIVAIGGETTGVTITANKVTWELDFSQAKDLQKLATELNGKTVDVTGKYIRKPGVEIRERHIVVVETLKAAAK